MTENRLAHHILPSSSRMLAVCLTGIGLVKIVEGHGGPSRVDEYFALASLLFLTSSICSYVAIRHGDDRPESAERFESVADICFIVGLVALTLIWFLFAYEFV